MRIKDDKLSVALNSFVDEMDEVLGEKEEQGKTGWDEERYYPYILKQMENDCNRLVHDETVDDPKKLLVDIANRAIMLWYQLETKK